MAIGKGLHDSSSSIIPLLEDHTNSDNQFILLSTGTWIICMNPFSKETLTANQLKNDCLCFMTPDKKQIKSSMQFLGRVHEVNAIALSEHFGVEKNHYLELVLNKTLCSEILSNNKQIFFPNEIAEDFIGDLSQLKNFDNYESAYYQLIFEISQRVHEGINRILDSKNNLKDVYISGGFNKNEIFVEYLDQLMPEQNILFPKGENASALGAALLMKDYLN
jgi:sugar (pentulose or hexulose) kinase